MGQINIFLKKSIMTIFLYYLMEGGTAQTFFDQVPHPPPLTIGDYWNFGGQAFPIASPFGQFRGGHIIDTTTTDTPRPTAWKPRSRHLVQTIYDDQDVDRRYPTSIVVPDDDESQDDQRENLRSRGGAKSYLTPPERPNQNVDGGRGHIYDYRHYDQIAYGDPAGLLTFNEPPRSSRKDINRLPGGSKIVRVRGGGGSNKRNNYYFRPNPTTNIHSYGNFAKQNHFRNNGLLVDDVGFLGGNLEVVRQLTREISNGHSNVEPLTKIDLGQAMEDLNSICGHTMYFFRNKEFGFLCARKFRERMLQMMKK